ncbi:hypothetical protein SKAU_G00042000 [Synaphobranchus kaupii]|uniref:Uncharacterized protein n=1 Tax=Synaphobranchus kaupii TaxID=118154 RepID=A0A9Q1J8W5_SYNKA|nr:hypothetical protein SKAU_G00042000 [Synaphobranchus kaupii]
MAGFVMSQKLFPPAARRGMMCLFWEDRSVARVFSQKDEGPIRTIRSVINTSAFYTPLNTGYSGTLYPSDSGQVLCPAQGNTSLQPPQKPARSPKPCGSPLPAGSLRISPSSISSSSSSS